MFLEAADKVKIAYDWYPSTSSGQVPLGYLLLVHMMPATKESWRAFALAMQKEGYSSLAIDLRGHGASDGGPDGYKKFSDSEHQKSILDLEVAVQFLKEQGATSEKTAVIGASIGANLAFWYLAENSDIKTAVLLSPGEDYQGIRPLELVKRLSVGQRLLLIASRDDVRGGGDIASFTKKLAGSVSASAKAEHLIYDRGGHGTELLEQAMSAIKNFIGDLL